MEQTSMRSVRILEILDQLPFPSKKFVEWTRTMVIHNPKQLEFILQSIIDTENARSLFEALDYLNTFMRRFSFDGLRLTTADLHLRRRRTHDAFKQLTRCTPSNNKRRNVARLHGIIGHSAIPKLLTGKLIETGANPNQQYELFPNDEGLPDRTHTYEIARALNEIRDCWEKLRVAPYITGEKMETSEVVTRLYTALELIFGQYFQQLQEYGKPPNGGLLHTTLMSWAAAVLYHDTIGDQILFLEIPVLAPTYGFDGGRIDAIHISHSNNTALTPMERELLLRVGRKKQYRSAGQLLAIISRLVREPLVATIKDWKCAVGEGKGGMRRHILTSNEIAHSPLPEHARQIRQYLALTRFDYMLQQKKYTSPDIELRGELVYFLPDCLPVSHSVTLNNEKMESFMRIMASRWENARRESRFREVGSLIAHHAANLSTEEHVRYASRRLLPQGLLFPGDILRHPFTQAIRDFLDTIT